MNKKYIYSASAIRAAENNLLSKEQLNRLLTSTSPEEISQALSDTFIGPKLSAITETINLQAINQALEESTLETKDFLNSIAPEPYILNTIWFKYDLHNIRSILSGQSLNLSEDETMSRWISPLGYYKPGRLSEALSEINLKYLQPSWGVIDEALKKSGEAGHQLDTVIDTAYLSSLKQITKKAPTVIKDYTALVIDLHNITNTLRYLHNQRDNHPPIIYGGSITDFDLNQKTTEEVLRLFYRFGGENVWSEAVNRYKQTGQFTELTRTIDNYLNDYLIYRSKQQVFSPATLLAYFNKKKNDTKIIRTAVAGLMAKLPAEIISSNLRKISHV